MMLLAPNLLVRDKPSRRMTSHQSGERRAEVDCCELLHPSRTKHERGFSLVEVMCAILILGVGLVGLAQGVVLALSSTKDSELQTRASWIASGQIESLRADGFVTSGTTEGDCGDLMPGHQWRQTITRTDLDGLFDVKVAILNTSTGKSAFELETFLFDPPLSTSTGSSEPMSNKERAKNRRKTGGGR